MKRWRQAAAALLAVVFLVAASVPAFAVEAVSEFDAIPDSDSVPMSDPVFDPAFDSAFGVDPEGFAMLAAEHKFHFPDDFDIHDVVDGNTVLGPFVTSDCSPEVLDFLTEWKASDLNFLVYDLSSFSVINSPGNTFVNFLIVDSGNLRFSKRSNSDEFFIHPSTSTPLVVRCVAFRCRSSVPASPLYDVLRPYGDIVSRVSVSPGGEFRCPGYLFESSFLDSHPERLPDFPVSSMIDVTGDLILKDDSGLFLPPVTTHTLTVNYQYADGTTAAPSAVQSLEKDTPYSVASPAIAGHTPDKPTVSGTMGEADQAVTVTYAKNIHTLTVRYQGADGTPLAEPVTQQVAYGAAYNVTSPVITGYTPDKSAVSGTMGDSDLTFTVTYLSDNRTLVIHYVYEDGTTAAPTVSLALDIGNPYEVSSPVLEGCTPDKPMVSGTMSAEAPVVTVTYTRERFDLVIHYTLPDGSQAAPDVTRSVPFGEAYSVTSPTVAGYKPSKAVVSGTMRENVIVTVTYAPGTTDPGGDPSQPGGDPSKPGGGALDGIEWHNPFAKPSGDAYNAFWGNTQWHNPFAKPSGDSSSSDSSENAYNPFEKPKDDFASVFGSYKFHNPFARPSEAPSIVDPYSYFDGR